jgi:hypothetical protein
MQINLGECIKQLKKAIKDAEKDGNIHSEMRFDFPGIYCGNVDSYRGYYEQLSLTPCIDDGNTAEDLLEIFEKLKEKKESRAGYKGGEYWYSEKTPVWVAPYGESSNKAVSSIDYDGYLRIIIHTCDK